MARVLQLKIKQINVSGSTQTRAEMSEETITDYAEAIEAGADFPPIVVFWDKANSTYWLADGFHRLEAHIRKRRATIEADVMEGGKRDAVLYACGSNEKHGLRRTNADKVLAIRLMLMDEEWAKWSDKEIARRCQVTDRSVGIHRAALVKEEKLADNPKRMATRGKQTYEIDTTNCPHLNAQDKSAKLRQLALKRLRQAEKALAKVKGVERVLELIGEAKEQLSVKGSRI